MCCRKLKINIKTRLNYYLSKLGYRILRIERSGWKRSKSEYSNNLSIYVGCGIDTREGFINCDIRALKGVDLVCCAWDLPKYAQDITAIYSRHTLEHLTDAEARHTLDQWFKALKTGGTVEIIVPNLKHHIEQWLKADWENEGPVGGRSDARYGFAGFYGWQRECDPRSRAYNQSYWDVHKSGYDNDRMSYLLREAGFGRIQIGIVDQVHLVAKATKITQKDERQVSPSLQGIRKDHLERYELVKKYLKPGDLIGDFACGVGYGSYLLSQEAGEINIKSADIDPGAIEYAEDNFKADNITYVCSDLMKLDLEAGDYDIIVSYETIEHIDDYETLLNLFYKALKPGGHLFCSTPNEDVIPLSEMKNPFHFRHFTPDQFEDALLKQKFSIKEKLTQKNRESGTITQGWDGMYNIVIAQKQVAPHKS